MSSARYVGRVGALAVALGIGAVIAGVPGVAWAGPEGEPEPSDPPGVSAHGESGWFGRRCLRYGRRRR